MKDFFKSKFGTILVLLATVVLAGIAIFTAYRLYKLRQEAIAPNAPTSEPAAATCTEQCPGSDGILRNCHPKDSDGTSKDSICNSGANGRVERCGSTYDYCCNESWKKISTACKSSTKGTKGKCGEIDICCNGSNWVKDLTFCQTSASPSASPGASPNPNQCTLTFTISEPSSSPSVSPSPSLSPSPFTSPSPSLSPSPFTSPSSTATSTTTAGPSTTSENQAELPEAGTSLPTILGLGSGAILLIISLLLAL